jgi:hypothetical protein
MQQADAKQRLRSDWQAETRVKRFVTGKMKVEGLYFLETIKEKESEAKQEEKTSASRCTESW